jgi:hypothetical protein
VFLNSAAAVPVPVAISDSSNFAKGGGSTYSDANQQSHGEKGATGYKTVQEYDKGAQAKHDNQGEKEYHSQEGGHKAAHHDEAGHYGQKEEAAKGSQGSHFHQSKSHKKGSKTTGFHRVHHKDEYKKDHSFYDESDSSGHFNKHGDYDSHRASEKGGFEGDTRIRLIKQGRRELKDFWTTGSISTRTAGLRERKGSSPIITTSRSTPRKGTNSKVRSTDSSRKKCCKRNNDHSKDTLTSAVIIYFVFVNLLPNKAL